MTTIATTEREQTIGQYINPFYSPSVTDDGNEQYKYAQYKVRTILGIFKLFRNSPLQPAFPDVSWEPLKEVNVIDRGLGADPDKRNLLSVASKVITLTPTIGTELHGVDLRHLSDAQKNELYALVYSTLRTFLRSGCFVQIVSCC